MWDLENPFYFKHSKRCSKILKTNKKIKLDKNRVRIKSSEEFVKM